MKINKILIVILGLLSLLSFSGCEKVLDKVPKTAITEADLWNDASLVEKYVYATYNTLPTVWGISVYNTDWNGAIEMLATCCDESFTHNNCDNIYVWNSGNITSDNMGPFSGLWKGRYNNIKDCNLFLEQIDQLASTDQTKINTWKGEIKFLRAYSYACLIDYWGGVPLITKVFVLTENFDVKRNSYQECVDFIVNELNEAAELVPDTWSTDNWGRVTKGACLALKSRVLLHAASLIHDPSTQPSGSLFDYTKGSKWQDAADAAKAVLDLPQYALQPVNTWQDYAKIFTQPNSEIILATPRSAEFFATGNYYALMEPDYINLPSGYMSWSTNCPTQDLVDAFEMNNGKMINEPGSGYNADAESIFKNREMRFYADIMYNGCVYQGREVQYWVPGGKDSREGTQGWDYGQTGYNIRKFLDSTYVLPNYNRTGTQPRIHFRLAEIYLNYAEAEYRLGQEDVARQYVNIIRRRVNLPDITTSGVDLFNDIIHERRIELCFEDQRFYDVRRWMITDQTEGKTAKGIAWSKVDGSGNLSTTGALKYDLISVQTRSFSPKMYYLPVPLSEMQKAKSLEQNPGY
jgi:starch-binding outer membrane protein, SusD/RagB family